MIRTRVTLNIGKLLALTIFMLFPLTLSIFMLFPVASWWSVVVSVSFFLSFSHSFILSFLFFSCIFFSFLFFDFLSWGLGASPRRRRPPWYSGPLGCCWKKDLPHSLTLSLAPGAALLPRELRLEAAAAGLAPPPPQSELDATGLRNVEVRTCFPDSEMSVGFQSWLDFKKPSVHSSGTPMRQFKLPCLCDHLLQMFGQLRAEPMHLLTVSSHPVAVNAVGPMFTLARASRHW